MSGPDALERGYRRLLACYPAWHRQDHAEEMIGVLLASAPDGKRRPGPSEIVNLLWAGLLIRLRPRAAGGPGGGWRDALAVFSVVAPVALTGQMLAGWLPWHVGSPLVLAVLAAYFGLGLALPLVLLRLRRVAAVVSLLAAAALAWFGLRGVLDDAAGHHVVYPLIAYLAEAAALLGSAGPRRGLQLMTRRAWALTGLAAACAGVTLMGVSDGSLLAVRPPRVQLTGPHGSALMVDVAVVAAAAAGLLAIAIWVGTRSALSRRILLMFAALLYVELITSATLPFTSPVAHTLLYLVPPLAAAWPALHAAYRSRRGGPDGAQPA